MSLFSVVMRVLDKAGTGFIEMRREDGHGSDSSTPTYVELDSAQVQTDGLTDAELRASALSVEALALNSLIPVEFDDIELVYTGEDLTSVVYRSLASIVATLTLTYSSGVLTRVVRT